MHIDLLFAAKCHRFRDFYKLMHTPRIGREKHVSASEQIQSLLRVIFQSTVLLYVPLEMELLAWLG